MSNSDKSHYAHESINLDHLDAFPLVKELVIELSERTQAPIELVLASVLSVISLLTQQLINVQRPGGMIGPVSLIIILIAASGERKTTVESILLAYIWEAVRAYLALHKKALGIWTIRIDAWEVRKKKIQVDMAKEPIDSDEYLMLEKELLLHQEKKPERPRGMKLIYEDATMAALLKGMRLDSPSAALMSSEGISILKGALNDFGKINALWSGTNIEVDRASVEGCSLHDARLTICMMLQHEVLHDYLEGKGHLARSVGLLSRSLTFQPESTQGTRFISNRIMNNSALDKYTEKVKFLLTKNAEMLNNLSSEKILIEFDPDAEDWWISTYNRIEAGLQEGGEFDRSKDHASKLSENIARIAASLHFFEHGTRVITLKELKAAEHIAFHCSKTFRKKFMFMPKIENDAEILLNWLQARTKGSKVFPYVDKNTILRYGPAKLRSIIKLGPVLDCLIRTGRVRELTNHKPTRIEIIY
ncbi:Protein of unknown function [Pseudomonas guineae]|uniref:DUF3987 domain-containing protein n=1 Tax=Pseudomonas guineae TaxID=425504 RepID=A0A1I3HCA6_9PSED|nr:YfjI family protein [Pseudomonas guineae]SFI33281.1 Protein of unknown function [Pseudomonas guineae]